MKLTNSWTVNALALVGVWLVCTTLLGAFLGFIGAIAWRVAQWLV
jgi:hypothetical protein